MIIIIIYFAVELIDMEVSKRIREAGLKVTQQRRIVYQSMRELGHSAIDAVIANIREEHPDISVATIYRIMELFCEAGLLLKFNGPNGRMFFDITPQEHPHFFTSQNRIIDVEGNSLMELIYKHLAAQLPAGEMLDKVSICVTTKALSTPKTTNTK